MKCPRDQAELRPKPCGTEEIHGCGTCHGLWIGAEAQQICFPTRWHRRAVGRAKPLYLRDQPANLVCPGCASILTTFLVESVEIDRCPNCHGLWLDAGEFRKTLDLYPAVSLQNAAGHVVDGAVSVADIASTNVISQVLEAVGEISGEAAEKLADAIVEFLSGLFSAF